MRWFQILGNPAPRSEATSSAAAAACAGVCRALGVSGLGFWRFRDRIGVPSVSLITGFRGLGTLGLWGYIRAMEVQGFRELRMLGLWGF